MSKLLFNLLYGSVCLLLLLICSLAIATDVYISTDQHGRPQYSDHKPVVPHQVQRIDIENNFEWADAPKFKSSVKRKSKSRRTKKQERFTLSELKTRCQAARGKYSSYRANAGNVDWDSYRAKLERYKTRRDEWCGRLLKGK